MKKIIKYSSIPGLVLISALFFLSVSCNKDTVENNPNADNSSQLIKVSGEDANAATKTTLNGLVTSWVVTNDKVGIYCAESTGGNINVQYTASSTAFSSAFSGNMKWGTGTHNFYAYYPYLAGSAAATVVPITLAAAQTQSAGNSSSHLSALDFLVATPKTVVTPGTTGNPTTVDLRYNHVFTVLEFQIKGTGQLKAIKLSANSTLAFSGGTINITQATPATAVAYAIAGQTGTTNQVVVTLDTPATLSTSTATTVYMVINPGTQTGNSTIGLSSDGTNYSIISKEAPVMTSNPLVRGFSRGKKYVVSIEADQDGNFFSTVKIGTQTWMAENLKTTRYNDGTNISNVTNNTTWAGLTTGAYCYYNNNVGTDYGATYGALYNWFAVNTGKLCPTGWHVPSEEEWSTLSIYLGGEAVVGGMLKETGTTHWTSPNTGATNSSGFTALPGGYSDFGIFKNIGTQGCWWSSTAYGSDIVAFHYMKYDSRDLTNSGTYRKDGLSVRCLKD